MAVIALPLAATDACASNVRELNRHFAADAVTPPREVAAMAGLLTQMEAED